MNAPFTEGQKETFSVIAQVLKLYFQNHSIYMRIAENKANWLDSLLDGVDVSVDILSNYLARFQWKLDDYFCIVTFAASTSLKIPIVSILDIRQINDLFPNALVSVYEEYVVMIIRCPDRKQPHGKKKQQLEQFLKKDILLCCGVSMVFNNFLHLRYYYTQSTFAAAQCKSSLSPAICFYEDYQADHVLQTLSLGTDLRCFCHPGILSLWESGNELQRDLVHCLYHYFLNGKNISAAAEAIHIHRNTLIYRLNKAEEILNVDIKQPSEKQTFLFIISCIIVQHL
jgi:sugar diacid utilization regulator